MWRAVVRDSEALTARLNRPGMDGIPSLLERYLAAAIKGDTVDYLIMHELIMHKSRNAWVLVGNNDGTRGKCIHNA